MSGRINEYVRTHEYHLLEAENKSLKAEFSSNRVKIAEAQADEVTAKTQAAQNKEYADAYEAIIEEFNCASLIKVFKAESIQIPSDQEIVIEGGDKTGSKCTRKIKSIEIVPSVDEETKEPIEGTYDVVLTPAEKIVVVDKETKKPVVEFSEIKLYGYEVAAKTTGGATVGDLTECTPINDTNGFLTINPFWVKQIGTANASIGSVDTSKDFEFQVQAVTESEVTTVVINVTLSSDTPIVVQAIPATPANAQESTD